MNYYNGKQSQGAGWMQGQNVCAAVDRNRRKPVMVRSAFMRAEEIDEERRRSGWNQYAGEEEALYEKRMPMVGREEMERAQERMYGDGMESRVGWQNNTGRMQMPDGMPSMDRGQMPDGMISADSEQMPDGMPGTCRMQMPQNIQGQPYFRMPDYTQVLEEQKQRERDLQKLRSMYPEAAKILLPYIEEECDKMEYEGSVMFDEYPDQTTIQRIQEQVLAQAGDQFPPQEKEEPDDMLSMQYQGRRNRPGKNWLEDLTRVLLLQEMHHRRCRHRDCRRGRW